MITRVNNARRSPRSRSVRDPCWVRAIGEPPAWAMTWRARICAAAFVLAGKAVALQWPRDGELELAMHGRIREPLRQAVQPLEEIPGDVA